MGQDGEIGGMPGEQFIVNRGVMLELFVGWYCEGDCDGKKEDMKRKEAEKSKGKGRR